MRLSALRSVLAAVSAVVLVSGSVMLVPAVAAADVTQVSVDPLRTGWDPAEPGLSPAVVGGAGFGQLFSSPVTGQVYAQPLLVKNTVVTATESNDVYGLDPATGAQRWHRSLGPAWPASAISCGDLGPTIGVTSTPAIDASGTVYLTSKTYDGVDPKTARYLVHGLNASTGAELPGWPVEVKGSPVNEPAATFTAFSQLQRPGVTLVNGTLYLAFGSHCDYGDYRGYVASVATGATPRMSSLWTAEATTAVANPKAGIWQAGGGLAYDGAGHLFFATGNGIEPPAGPGSAPPATLAQSVVRLDLAADGSVKAGDFFAPSNADALNSTDQDLGSGAVSGLAPGLGTTAYPHLAVAAGKEGKLFLLNRDHLGGRSQGPGATDAVLGSYPGVGPLFGGVASWTGAGGYVYYPAMYGPLRAFSLTSSSTGVPGLQQVGSSQTILGFGSGSPLVTSSGTTSGSGLVWIISSADATGANAVLTAYDAVPVGGKLVQRFQAPIGTSAKFTRPASDSGRVYVGTRDGHLIGFGARTSTVPLSGQATSFGSVATGTTATATVTLVASGTVTITGLATTPSVFGVGAVPLPTTMTNGQSLTVPVTFHPTAPGATTGSLNVTTSAGPITTSLSGTGTTTGISAAPATAAFGNVPVGQTQTLPVTVTNTGTGPATVKSSTAPVGPFSVTGVPTAGTVIGAGQSVGLTTTFAPTALAAANSSLTITTDSSVLTIPLTGTGAKPPVLTLSATSVDFGSVAVGTSKTASFTLSNTGGSPLTITLAKAPAGVFSTTTPLPEGSILAPGATRTQNVTFTPATTGTATAAYLINSNDGSPLHTVALTGTGTSAPPAGGTLPPPSAGGWSLNGSAVLSGSDLVLTPATAGQAGTAIAPQVVPSDGLRASFTTTIGGGTGADGLTFALLDPTTPKTARGVGGGGLGFSGLTGTALAVDTWQSGGAPNNNFVGITTGGVNDALTFSSTSTNVGPLRTGTHTFTVAVTAGRMTITADGVTVLDQAVTLPTTVLPAFTGGTGGATDQHTISNVTITTGNTAPPPAPTENVSATPSTAAFGNVPVGQTQTLPVTVTNTGTGPATVKSSTAPVGPFSVTGVPAAGTVIGAGQSVGLTATFAPTALAAANSSLTITTDSSVLTIPLTGTGTSAPPAGGTLPPPSAGGWSLNGSAVLSGSDLVLTPATAGQAGTAIAPQVVPSDGLRASFTTTIGGGTGADGLTFALLDPTTPKTARGVGGGGLGFSGLTGTALAVDTWQSGGAPNNNFVGITTGGVNDALTFSSTSTNVGPLRTGTHTFTVAVTAGRMTITADGVTVLDQAVTLPTTVLPAFTGGTGGATDQHTISNVTITHT